MSAHSLDSYDVIVVGAGHAGCEAALAAARMGARTLVVTANTDHIGHMPCNCSIGGPAKAHLAREIDALGGEMGRNIDATYTHIRMLNTSKGPAVQSLRAQADVVAYQNRLTSVLLAQPLLTVKQGNVVEILTEAGRATGVVTTSGDRWNSATVIVTVGTFLNAVMRVGELAFPAGRAGDPPATALSDCYRKLGFALGRLKTGTVPRVHRDSIDLTAVEVQHADSEARWFSFENLDRPARTGLLDCWVTHTTEETGRIVRSNLHRSSLYGGFITGTGPRYCPSFEDKIVKFPDRKSHHVFLEQEGWDRPHVYAAGLSNSLPFAVQEKMVHSVPGLQHARMVRPGYAIEYDYVPPTQLQPTLETKLIAGLFHAGQINGTSGYEEAGAQGLVAAINALACLGAHDPLVLERSEAYTGVMIDDLVTKGADEPYRMFTSRAEFRLLLRQGNADRRLTPYGWKVGLIDGTRWTAFRRKQQEVAEEIESARTTAVVPSTSVDARLSRFGSAPLKTAQTVAHLMKRPELSFRQVWSLLGQERPVTGAVAEEVEIELKYEGYLRRQQEEVDRFRRHESQRIPEDLAYENLSGLRKEAVEQLARVRPRSLGQAARVPGVTPADVAILGVHVHRLKRLRMNLSDSE